MSRLATSVGMTLFGALQLVGAIVWSTAVVAQEAAASDTPSLPMYRVEVLIFRHLDQSRTTEEVLPPPETGLPSDFDIDGIGGLPDTTTPDNRADSAAGNVGLPTGSASSAIEFLLLEPVPAPPDFVQLLPAQFKLTDAWDKLIEVEAYEPVLHIAWLQPARAEDGAVPYDLAITDADPDIVTGTLTLYKQRFLHLDVDLTMREADGPADNSGGGFWSRFSFDLDDEDVEYRINQSRRIRGDTLQYFDHPRFGVIAAIAELPVEENDAPETVTRAL